jgi:hypothetical protein
MLWVMWQDIVKNLHERTWSSLDLQVVQERCVNALSPLVALSALWGSLSVGMHNI